MITSAIKEHVLFSAACSQCDKLLILSGYASPNMASWLITARKEKKMKPVDIELIIGMSGYWGISLQAHNAFMKLHGISFGKSISRFKCFYMNSSAVPVHANLYIWLKDNNPVIAYTGSPDFTQSAFLSGRREIVMECNPISALDYFNKAETDSISCSHGEVESYIRLTNKDIFDDEYQQKISGDSIEKVTLSFLTKNGNMGTKSSLNWGQRLKRNKNQAYIPVPAKIAKSDFFPADEQHFTAISDDGHHFILRVEQQGNKAITTPLSNAHIGEYFRNRLGLENGAFVRKEDLLRYGRTDVTFSKLDDEQFYMDFSV